MSKEEAGYYLGYLRKYEGENGVVVEGPMTHPELISKLFKISAVSTQTYAENFGQAALQIIEELNFSDWLKT